MARKALKVTIDDTDFYLKVVSPGQWGAFHSPEDEYAAYEFAAPEDATVGELESELDYLIMETADENGTDDSYEDEDEYAYSDRW